VARLGAPQEEPQVMGPSLRPLIWRAFREEGEGVGDGEADFPRVDGGQGEGEGGGGGGGWGWRGGYSQPEKGGRRGHIGSGGGQGCVCMAHLLMDASWCVHTCMQ
jgi:hypothetical protein